MMVVAAALVALLVTSTGCALQSRGDMTAQITTNAAVATPIVAAGKAGTLTAQEARDYVAGPGLVLQTYYQTATVNVWEYWFGKSTILVTPALYTAMQSCAADAYENAHRAATSPDADVVKRAAREAQNVIDVDLARRGTKPQN
jgi:hypothetical protein